MSDATTSSALLLGLVPAFRNVRNGETHLACDERGHPSDAHRIDQLPSRWISERDASGNPVALHPDIVAGFRRGCDFIALGEQIELPLDG